MDWLKIQDHRPQASDIRAQCCQVLEERFANSKLVIEAKRSLKSCLYFFYSLCNRSQRSQFHFMINDSIVFGIYSYLASFPSFYFSSNRNRIWRNYLRKYFRRNSFKVPRHNLTSWNIDLARPYVSVLIHWWLEFVVRIKTLTRPTLDKATSIESSLHFDHNYTGGGLQRRKREDEVYSGMVAGLGESPNQELEDCTRDPFVSNLWPDIQLEPKDYVHSCVNWTGEA